MSYNNPGGGYVPPPPPAASRRSPWLFVGLGCGGLIALVVIAGAVFFGNLSKEMQKPFDLPAAQKIMADTPIYPNAQFDENMSKGARTGLGFVKGAMPATEATAIAYSTSDTADKVLSWYDAEMPKNGYKPMSGGESPAAMGAKQNQYQKGKDVVMVQTQNPKAPGYDGKTVIILMRLNNLQGADAK